MVDEKEFTARHMDPHSFKRRRLGCPCPGIAILVNHGYLTPTDPHSRIKLRDLINALVEGYNLSWFHAAFLSILAVYLCGKWFSVSIAELGVHGKIEHDGSITRYDWGTGDSLNPDENLINEFLDASDPYQVSLDDYASRRTEIVSFSHEPWSFKTRLTALGEVGLTVAIFGDGKQHVQSTSLRTIFSEEKIPEGWKRPQQRVSIIDILRIGWNLNQKINKIKLSNSFSSSSSSSSFKIKS